VTAGWLYLEAHRDRSESHHARSTSEARYLSGRLWPRWEIGFATHLATKSTTASRVFSSGNSKRNASDLAQDPPGMA
jgi:hypothetical protein